MPILFYEEENGPGVEVDLREPYLAAFLAWLWPGAGHLYQRRFTKAFIYMICVLGMFFYGLGLGRGRCVYASWKENDKRWQYALQIGTGLPAIPAAIQNFKTRDGGEPFWVIAERYPKLEGVNESESYKIIDQENRIDFVGEPLKDGFMAPPAGDFSVDYIDVLGAWHREMRHRFEIGTLFTIIAGVLNMLAIYDAFAGPAIIRNEKKMATDPGGDESPDDAEAANKDSKKPRPPTPRSAKKKNRKNAPKPKGND